MEGLVGGLYAAGMDSSQITAIVEQADWNAVLTPIICWPSYSPPTFFPRSFSFSRFVVFL